MSSNSDLVEMLQKWPRPSHFVNDKCGEEVKPEKDVRVIFYLWCKLEWRDGVEREFFGRCLTSEVFSFIAGDNL